MRPLNVETLLNPYPAWVGDNNPNIDGRNRDQTFCVFQTRFDHYRQCSYQEVLGWLTIGFEGAYGSQPRNPAIETRALWNSEKNQAEFDYGTAPKEESAYHHNWRKSIRIAQLTQARKFLIPPIRTTGAKLPKRNVEDRSKQEDAARLSWPDFS